MDYVVIILCKIVSYITGIFGGGMSLPGKLSLKMRPKLLKTLLKNSVPGKNGEVIFSKKDKELADKELTAYIKEISKEALTISDKTADIDSGFIIRCGKIEINCSVDSIFEDKHSKLTDIVNACVNAAE